MSVNRNPAARKKCSSCNSRVSNVSNESNHCKGCVCEQLKSLSVGTTVTLRLDGINLNNYRFTSLNQDNCCAYFTTPSNKTAIVDCRKIQVIEI
ncbi:hydrolase [Lysinibacillus sp. 1 U-2021]|uniref:hydrolase n=1 Tax=Lysinibacillus sp. 1 U-2021 TaxID=3039426 RepID=UPI002480F194|nr:hydrolase [Lysinibacillus sp. 1 U-2021]WGT37312.1 hydrolase [Lysinibacillus sp. 1 U-2021]